MPGSFWKRKNRVPKRRTHLTIARTPVRILRDARPLSDDVEKRFQAYYTKLFDPTSSTRRDEIMKYEQHIHDERTGELVTNTDWLESRTVGGIKRFTGSIIGSVNDTNPYENFWEFVEKALWAEKTEYEKIPACVWGNDNEDNVQDSFGLRIQQLIDEKTWLSASHIFFPSRGDPSKRYRVTKYEIRNVGLVVDLKINVFGMSPDAIPTLWFEDVEGRVFYETYLGEWKAPYSKRDRKRHGKHIYPMSRVPNPNRNESIPFPPYYYDQVHWGAGPLDEFLTKPIKIFAGVWIPIREDSIRKVSEISGTTEMIATPKGTIEITKIVHDPAYTKMLRDKCLRRYELYARCEFYKNEGYLEKGELEPFVKLEEEIEDVSRFSESETSERKRSFIVDEYETCRVRS